MDFPYVYETTVHLGDGGDARAVGGAVTVALCGHWEHAGPCRWPHHTAARPADDGRHAVAVRYTCAATRRRRCGERLRRPSPPASSSAPTAS
jgi:hypothetical protein